jgi:hypothetical protein
MDDGLLIDPPPFQGANKNVARRSGIERPGSTRRPAGPPNSWNFGAKQICSTLESLDLDDVGCFWAIGCSRSQP